MTYTHGRDIVKPPETYMEWLECLDLIQCAPQNILELEELMRRGSFSGSRKVLSSLEQQLINSINVLLTKAVERLSSAVSVCIEDGSFNGMIHSYKQFRKTVLSTMFFEELSFLPISFRKELKASIEAQMKEFDKAFKKDMMNAAVENPGSELESAVTLISYIRLFD